VQFFSVQKYESVRIHQMTVQFTGHSVLLAPQKLFCVTHLVPRILRWLPDFWTIFGPFC